MYLSIESFGKVLKKYLMHKNFVIIAIQIPNKGAITNKRKELGIGFLSRFQKINFPNFTKEELIDIVSFHMDWQETNLICTMFYYKRN